MDAKELIAGELERNGYPASRLRHSYAFMDPGRPGTAAIVDLAAFTTDTPNYDSAAFGIICAAEQPSAERVADAVWLGAPIVFTVSSDDVGVWKILSSGVPTNLATIGSADIGRLFSENKSRWDPDALGPAKTRSLKPSSGHDALVDPGLLDFLDHQWEESCFDAFATVAKRIRAKMPEASPRERSERMYEAVRAELDFARGNPSGTPLRRPADGHEGSDLGWLPLLKNVSPITVASLYAEACRAAELTPSRGFKRLPMPISSYIANNAGFGEGESGWVIVPDAGPGSIQLMLASIRRRKSLMSADRTGADVAEELAAETEFVVGADCDATLARNAFKLATYPFEREPAVRRVPGGFGKLAAEGRALLADLRRSAEGTRPDGNSAAPNRRSRTSASTVAADLAEAVDSGVGSLSAILPRGFLHQKRFEASRRLLGSRFATLELAGFPRRSPWSEEFDACVVIAKHRRASDADPVSSVTSRSVADGDWERFLSGGGFTAASSAATDVREGNMWQSRFAEIWNALKNNPRLGEAAEVRRGFTISPDAERPVLGRDEAKRALQFGLRDADAVPRGFDRALRRAAHEDGARAKILVPAADLAGSAWPVRAFADYASLGATPAFLAVLPRSGSVPAEALEAILNGPLANAYFTEFMSSELSKALIESLPLPRTKDYAGIVAAVHRHKQILGAAMDAPAASEALREALNDSLVRVDAAVLEAYFIAPWLEKDLLRTFVPRNAERRAGFEFSSWWNDGYTGGLHLHNYVGPLYQKNKGAWILKAIEPLQEEEFEAVKPFMRP